MEEETVDAVGGNDPGNKASGKRREEEKIKIIHKRQRKRESIEGFVEGGSK